MGVGINILQLCSLCIRLMITLVLMVGVTNSSRKTVISNSVAAYTDNCSISVASSGRCEVLQQTLTQADTLHSTAYLVSLQGNSILGFFTPHDSGNSFLAICYAADYSKPVWIANRDTPIVDDSGILNIDNTGNFVINRIGDYPIVLYSGNTFGNSSNINASATLMNNGNLILRALNSDGSFGRTLWRSFDYPTDTLLPVMKLGMNYVTRRNWSLASWLAENNPSSGAFTLDWDPEGHELVVRRRGVVFWTSGVFNNEEENFKHLWLPLDYESRFITESSSDEDYFSYSFAEDASGDGNTPEGNSTLIPWWINYEGELHIENQHLDLQNMCYGYMTALTNRGCVEWTQPQCRNDSTTFELKSGSFIGPNGEINPGLLNKSSSPVDCRITCWNNCDCVGYNITNWIYCLSYTGDLQFEQDLSGSSAAMYVMKGQSSHHSM